MTAWFKFIHICGVSIWAAGLISLPGLYLQRTHVADEHELYRLQRTVRAAYIAFISPAAFVAIASGIGLIFLQETFVPWFSVKLAFVAGLVVIHALTGLVIIRLFREGQIYPVWRFIAATIVASTLVLAVLFLVLAKPTLTLELPTTMSEPGALRRIVLDIIPWTTP